MDPTQPTPWASAAHRTSMGSRGRALALGLALGGAALPGCAGPEGPPEETDAVTGTTGSSTPDGYPEGPYGADEGEVLPNLMWKGWVDDDGLGLATEGDDVDLDLDTVRRGGARWALVHFGAVF